MKAIITFQRSVFVALVVLWASVVSGSELDCYATAASGLNVRSGPGTEHPVVTVVECGTRLLGLTTDGDWVSVIVPGRGSDGSGWVALKYVSKFQPDCPSKKGSEIGRWQESIPGMPEMSYVIAFERSGSGYAMKTYHRDGSTGSQRLVQYYVGGERRFRQPDWNGYGEYYVIGPDGGLKMYDQEGYIKTAPAVR